MSKARFDFGIIFYSNEDDYMDKLDGEFLLLYDKFLKDESSSKLFLTVVCIEWTPNDLESESHVVSVITPIIHESIKTNIINIEPLILDNPTIQEIMEQYDIVKIHVYENLYVK